MRKKLFAILMSAMMMVTFMPTMAFATTVTPSVVDHATECGAAHYALENLQFGADYKTATADLVCSTTGCTHKYETISATSVTRTFETVGDHKGQVMAVATFDTTSFDKAVDPLAKNYAYYYDLTGASIVVKGANEAQSVANTSKTADEYLGYTVNSTTGAFATTNPLGDAVKFVEPADLVATGATADTVTIKINELSDFTVAVTAAAYEAYEAEGDYSLPVAITAKTGVLTVGSAVAAQTLKITTTRDMAWNHVFPTMDGVKGLTALTARDAETGIVAESITDVNYNGLNRVLGVSAKGVKVQYKAVKLAGAPVAPTAQAWTTEAPAIKDAGEYEVLINVTIEKTPAASTINKFFAVKFEVKPVQGSFAFGQRSYQVAEGFDAPNAYFVVAKGFAPADQEMADMYVEKYLTVDGYTTKQGSNNMILKVAVPTEAEQIADPALAAFVKNYNLSANNFAGFASLNVVEAKANKVTISTSKKTYKAKTLKKAKKSFTVSVKATSGEKATLVKVSGSKKLSVSGSKIVVKKGTKKGTYKIKVKASVKADGKYAAASATKTIKVKVK